MYMDQAVARLGGLFLDYINSFPFLNGRYLLSLTKTPRGLESCHNINKAPTFSGVFLWSPVLEIQSGVYFETILILLKAQS